MKDTLILTAIAIVGIAIAVAFLWFGSGQQHVSAPATSTSSMVAFKSPPRILAQGVVAPVDIRVNYLIKNDSELKQLWTLIYGAAVSTIPSVNFSKYDVAAVFAGTQSTTGYSISVFGMKKTPKKEIAIITITHPGPSCVVEKKHTSPYVVVLLPSSSLPLSHIDITKTNFCK